jgi:membrane protease YdiL (CAAX protease family)
VMSMARTTMMEQGDTTSNKPGSPALGLPLQATLDLECSKSEKPEPPPRPWGQWATIGLTVVCLVVMSGGETAAVIVLDSLGITKFADPTSSDSGINGNLLVVSSFLGTLATVGLVVLLVRARRCSLRDYLALTWAPGRTVLLSLAGMVILIVASDLTSYLSGRPLEPPIIVNIYRTAWLPGLIFTFVVLAPVGEETLFRGFLYKGIAASQAGPLAAIVFSAGAWALLHLQYDWYGIASIAVIGLYLGAVRLRTGSLLLTVLLHAVQNAVGTAELVVQESWLK